MYIAREISTILPSIAQKFSVIAFMGPRQSGKTTLARIAFPNHLYISLEDIDVRVQAKQDPRALLARAGMHGLILDEIQHVPELLSYIQTIVDAQHRPGFFVVTGSQNFLVNEAISQTLAGRMAVITLLPLCLTELKSSSQLPVDLTQLIFQGMYPGLYSVLSGNMIHVWYTSYITTYLERDVRQLTTVHDLAQFKLFMRLCAGRVGQLLNVTSLANDCGITLRVAQGWLSALQASYVIFLLQPYYQNFSKRLVKTPKLYFYDTGLACSLLGLESSSDVENHYARGALVENMVILDIIKSLYNRAREPHVYFWRDHRGQEIDCVVERGAQVYGVEIKAGMTINSDFFAGLRAWSDLTGFPADHQFLIYGGDQTHTRSVAHVLGWRDTPSLIETIYDKR